MSGILFVFLMGLALVVFVVVKELDVLVNVLVSSLVSPNMNKLVLVTNEHTEVAQTFSMQDIFVGIDKSSVRSPPPDWC